MKSRIDLYGILLHQFLSGRKITFTLDTLHFRQQSSEQFTQLSIVINHHVCLAIPLFQFNHVIDLSFFIYPFGNQLTVAHMGFFDILALLDPNQLCHQAIHYIFIVFGLISLCIRHKSEFHQLGISEIVQTEKIGTRLFQSRTVGLQSIRIGIGKQFTGTMSQAFMQIGMQIVGDESVFLQSFALLIAPDKFLIETISLRSFVICLSDILDRNGFRTMIAANPVGIRQVDANRSCRIAITSQHGNRNYFGTDSFYFFFLKPFIYRRMIFEPLRIIADHFCSLRCLLIDKVHGRLPAGFHS